MKVPEKNLKKVKNDVFEMFLVSGQFFTNDVEPNIIKGLNQKLGCCLLAAFRRNRSLYRRKQKESVLLLTERQRRNDMSHEETKIEDADVKRAQEVTVSQDTGTVAVKKKRKWLLVVLIAAAAVAACYLITAIYFTRHFLPNTTVNGQDVSGNTADEVRQKIADEVKGYQLELVERNGKETLKGSDFSLEAVFDDSIEQLLKKQNSMGWLFVLGKDHVLESETAVRYDEEAFAEQLQSLKCLDSEHMTKSKDAQVVFGKKDQYEIQPAVFGTTIREAVFTEQVQTSVKELRERLDLAEKGCYVDPVFTEDSKEVKAAQEKMNKLVQTKITYDMLDAGTVPVSKEEISNWLKTDKDMKVVFDEDGLKSFVADLAGKYNTVDKGHKLKTSWGPVVTVPAGNYGWKLNQSKEIETLKQNVLDQQPVTREPVFARRGKSHAGNDYGNTYVEINLTAQHLYFYKNGVKVVDTDFVSGNVSRGYTTPPGSFALTYKDRDAVLRGDDYETPVDFWMPFNGGIGLHDATWRGSFGGTIYKTNGSHGCVNLPYSAAEKIFSQIKTGDPVLCYQLPGTEKAAHQSEKEDASRADEKPDKGEDASEDQKNAEHKEDGEE